MAGKFACPKCGSENIQRCSVIYRQGTVSHSYTSTSGDYSVDTSGVESTELAQSVAPPEKKETHWGKMIVAGFFAVDAFVVDYTILAIILGLLTVGLFQTSQEASEYNDKQWPIDYKNWENTYFCHRCGNYFRM